SEPAPRPSRPPPHDARRGCPRSSLATVRQIISEKALLTAEAGRPADNRDAGQPSRSRMPGFFFISRAVIENPQIGAVGPKYAACSPLARNEQMSHTDELGPAYQSPVDAAIAKDVSRRGLDWAVLVVTFALGCT